MPLILGTVSYGNAIGTSPRFVSNVTITAAGSPTVVTTTAAPGGNAGQYILMGLGTGPYTVTPTKTTGVNSITSFDAARIAQHVAGSQPLMGNQLVVADVSNNGTISSFDSGQLARYVAGTPPYGSTGLWKFTPANRMYDSVTSELDGEDYVALLMGEVSGNWNNTGARAASVPSTDLFIELPHELTDAGRDVLLPITIRGTAGKEIISYEFDLMYDPAFLQPQAHAIELDETVSRGLFSVVNGAEPGRLRVVVYGPTPIESDGVLLYLRFNTCGAPGSTSPLSLENVIFNEGIRTQVSNGRVEISTG